MKTRMMEWFRRETVLAVSAFLAAGSCLLVKPDEEYLSYFSGNMDTILILFCLMIVVAGLRNLGVFRYVGHCLLAKIRSERGIVLLLVFLCFFGSMVITNDVALITFVPFGLLVLEMAGMTRSVCFVVTLMTIGANLGSMMTPIGNPQNLYLYSLSEMSFPEFVKLMLPYTSAAASGLFLCCFFGFRGTEISVKTGKKEERPEIPSVIYYSLLFLLCLQTVSGGIPAFALFLIIAGAVIVRDKELFGKADYSLLFTFLFFFVFIGNMNRYAPFRNFVVSIISGHETQAAILMSQVISNVPAALLLSNFTREWESLIVGTNLGGLGTLIASMASLISYKQAVSFCPEKKSRYLAVFTTWNLIFLAALWTLKLFL